MKVEGPDSTWKLPSQIQHQMELLHELIAADPEASEYVPDFLGLVRELLDQLREEPVVITLHAGTPREQDVCCGAYDLQRAIS